MLATRESCTVVLCLPSKIYILVLTRRLVGAYNYTVYVSLLQNSLHEVPCELQV